MDTFSLHSLASPRGRKRTRRVGRGHGSGRGTTAGRGTKGQKSRTGGRRQTKRRGLKMFLAQLPKRRGFTASQPKARAVNVEVLEKHFSQGDRVTPESLVQKDIIPSAKGEIRVLGGGTLTKKLYVVADGFSASAQSAILKAGGRAIVRS